MQDRTSAMRGNKVVLRPAKSLTELDQRMAKVTFRPIDCTDARTVCVPIIDAATKASNVPDTKLMTARISASKVKTT